MRHTTAIHSIIALAAALFLTFALTACRANPATTVLIVRHAEKGPGADPPLTDAGQRRAQDLIDVARDAQLAAIYTTQFLRTQQTAQPIADHLGLPLTIVPRPVPPATEAEVRQHIDDLAQRLLDEHRDRSILVVTHSDTAPMLVEALGAPGVEPIAEDEFGMLFVVIVRRDVVARLVRARYGE